MRADRGRSRSGSQGEACAAGQRGWGDGGMGVSR